MFDNFFNFDAMHFKLDSEEHMCVSTKQLILINYILPKADVGPSCIIWVMLDKMGISVAQFG